MGVDACGASSCTRTTPLYAMGQQGSSLGGKDGKDGKKEEKKRKYEPPPAPTRVGKRKKKRKGELGGGAAKLPQVTPSTRCRLRLLKLERVKDFLLMKEEYIQNQARLKPQEEKNEEERTKVDEIR